VHTTQSPDAGPPDEATRERLSELEGCVLGLVWLLGPCTSYSVRRTFLQSPSSQWSGSAGAIYPLMRRLERRALLRSTPHATGSRRSRHYELTKEGRNELTTWLSPPFSRDVSGIPPDPFRTRLSFVKALSPESQRSFFSAAEATLQSQIERAEHGSREKRRAGETIDYLISRGALLTAKARLAWMHEVRRILVEG
jgi:DNA-binding PadR family transcriptional regulator